MSEYQMIPQSCTTEQFLCFSEADFHERLVQFFRPFVSIRPMNWTCIQTSMTFFAPYFKFQEFADMYFDYIYGLFEDFRITDRTVIESCILMYTKLQLHYFGFRLINAGAFQYPVEVRQVCIVPHYELIMSPRCTEELLYMPFVYRDLKIVMRILRYVVPVYFHCRNFAPYVKDIIYSIRKDPFLHYVVFKCTWRGSDYLARAKRHKLTLMVLDFVLQVRVENCEDAIKGLRLLFQTIPDSYITWQEIFEFLTCFLTFLQSEIKSSYIKSLQESCARCFPECLRVLKPRSLKHLARCKVRRCLGLAHTLPHGVWSLGLPRELEDYTLLQRQKDQFRPVIRPLSSERVFVL